MRIDWNGMYACALLRYFFLSLQRIVFVFVFAGYTFSAPQFSHLQTYIYNTQSVSLSLSIGLCPLHARRARFRNFGFFFKKNEFDSTISSKWLFADCLPHSKIIYINFMIPCASVFFLHENLNLLFFFLTEMYCR